MNDDEFRIAELERLTANLLKVGTISAVDTAAARARVTVGEIVTAPLPWFTRRAGGDRDWWSPEPGEQVMVLSPCGDMAQGVVLPAIYHDGRPAPSNDGNVARIVFADGAVVEHDRAGRLTRIAALDGKGTLVLEAKNIVLRTGEGGYFHVDHFGKATRLTHEGGAAFKSETWTKGSATVGVPDHGFGPPRVSTKEEKR